MEATMNELFPAFCGALIGLICARIDDVRRRTECWLLLSLVCGVAATIISGEFRRGWEYLLIDVPLAAVAAISVMTVLRQLRHRQHANRRSG
jgi:hypothetical protein